MEQNNPERMTAYLRDMTEDLNASADLDQMEMYRLLTQLGNEMEGLSEEGNVDENFVEGCVSNVYVEDHIDGDVIRFRGSSESHIVRGYLAILVEALSGLTPRDLVTHSEAAVSEFAERTNIRASLTPSRANAFGNIYKLMRAKAEAKL